MSRERRARLEFMSSCMKTLQIFGYDVKHFLVLYTVILVLILYHPLPVDPTVIILQGVCSLALEKAGWRAGVAGNVLPLGRLLEGTGGLGEDAGRPGPWGLWEREEEGSPAVPWGGGIIVRS